MSPWRFSFLLKNADINSFLGMQLKTSWPQTIVLWFPLPPPPKNRINRHERVATHKVDKNDLFFFSCYYNFPGSRFPFVAIFCSIAIWFQKRCLVHAGLSFFHQNKVSYWKLLMYHMSRYLLIYLKTISCSHISSSGVNAPSAPIETGTTVIFTFQAFFSSSPTPWYYFSFSCFFYLMFITFTMSTLLYSLSITISGWVIWICGSPTWSLLSRYLAQRVSHIDLGVSIPYTGLGV